MEEKLRAWQMASELVEPIIEMHGLELVRAGQANFFVPPPTTFTKVDQHIEHVLRVANWLVGVD